MKSVRLMTAALAAVLALTTPTALAAPKAPKRLELSNKHNRQSFTVHKGADITVRLSGTQTDNSTWAWSVPTSAVGTVLRREATGRAANGDVTAVFRAVADGTTTLDSQLRCAPRKPGHACSQAVVPWQATVKVAH
ncbi:hypothetical protein [Streptomyces sp. I05A-00742]|uniref:hypothetical protein n=1 Tax=Streptomyces sp. I05A-00742 TaxID=2732853 RepID=UPI0014889190|nr:hypothetical protein [Streptomyces sp. I05A-00742]